MNLRVRKYIRVRGIIIVMMNFDEFGRKWSLDQASEIRSARGCTREEHMFGGAQWLRRDASFQSNDEVLVYAASR